MSFAAIAYSTLQYEDFAEQWIKAYEEGTPTPKVMATDATGVTTAAKFQLNAQGFPVTAGSALVIPFIDGAYDLWLFPTEAEADANDTSNAIQIADNIIAPPVAGSGSTSINELTTATMAANTNKSYEVGDVVETKEFSTGNSGGGTYDVVLTTSVTPNTFDIIVGTADTSISFVLRVEYPVNPLTFGVTKDGVDSSLAGQAIIDFVQVAGGSVEFSEPGDYELRGITIDGPASEIPEISEWTKITSLEGVLLKNTAADGSNMFTISSLSATNFLNIDIASAQMDLGGGHIIDIQGTLNHSQINITLADQNEPSKSIINHSDTGFFFNKVNGIYWSITSTHSVPAIQMSSTTNKISANEFNILRPDRSGTAPFMVIDCTDASDFNFSNQIRLTNPERCDGGALRISGAAGTIIHPMTCFDNGTITNHMIEIGVATFDCKNTTIYNFQRNAGTLNSGIKDIMLTDANNTTMISPSGTSAGQIIEIDLGMEPTNTIVGGKWNEIINYPQQTNELTIESGAITAFADAGGGLVTVTSAAHNLIDGFATTISGTTSYNGRFTVSNATVNTFDITVTWVADDATGSLAGRVVIDSDYHRIDTEADASTDTLSDINGGYDGQALVLQSESAARDTTIDTAGNIKLAGAASFVLTRISDTIQLIYNFEDSAWNEISRSDNQT